MTEFDKLYTVLIERYGGYQDSVRIFYHGTKIENLRSILKQGLIVGRQSTGWGSNEQPGVHEPTLKAIPNSVYVTEFLGTAEEAAGHDPDGHLIVVMQLTDRIIKSDEDDIKHIISPNILDTTQKNIKKDDAIIWEFLKRKKNPSHNDVYQKKWVDNCLINLKETGKLSDIHIGIIINKLKPIYDVFLMRQSSYIPKYREYLKLNKTTDYYESKYLDAMDWLTSQTRHLTNNSDDEYRPENGRLTQSVGYRGKNKIVCVFSVKNYYEATLHYGEPPAEVKEIYFSR